MGRTLLVSRAAGLGDTAGDVRQEGLAGADAFDVEQLAVLGQRIVHAALLYYMIVSRQ